MKIFALTDVGRRRDANEDAYYINHDQHVFAVADGMGGHNAGDVASRIVRDFLTDMVVSDDVALTDIFKNINSRIFDESDKNEECKGMGTTLTLLKLIGEQAKIAHIGDSRAYLIRGESIKQLTTDHTMVNELLRIEQITPEEAATHPYQNVLSRALGVEKNIIVEEKSYELQDGDRFLLSTDGLHGAVSDEEIRQIFTSEDNDAEAIAEKLMEEALQRGGKDNITVIVITSIAID